MPVWVAVVLLLGSIPAAEAGCNLTSNSATSATIIMLGTGPANTLGVCVTKDAVLWGLYGTSNGANPNADAKNNLPMTANGQTYTSLSYTTSKASYSLVPVPIGGDTSQLPEYDLTINTLAGSGTDTITLWYASDCSHAANGCSGAGTTNTTFTINVVLPSPTVTAIAPSAGPISGGTSVTISGTGFTGASAVKFGAANATSFTVNSSASITATSPVGTAGAVDVTVTNSGKTSATSAADQFTYTPAPTVTAISPATGTAAGGTSVTITGTNLAAASAVRFGSTSAASYTVNSATQITATSPAGSGTVDVTVTTAGGTSATSAADQFTYIPLVTAISPASGPTTGSTAVTITGNGFTGASAVKFGAANATSFTVNSATQITATSPSGAAGTIDVTVTTSGQTSPTSAADQFTYAAAPTVTSISPSSGPASGSTSVIITGTGFTAATAVSFGATAATSYTVNSATQITAFAPAGTGTVDVRVTGVGGTSATSAADQFSYLGAPAITAISPATGPSAGGTSVTISGSGFAGTTGLGAVKFGAVNATSYTVNSASSITAIAPAGTGAVDVTVTNNAQTSAVTAAGRFSYVTTATQTSLASSRNPSEFRQPVTFTATVTAVSGTATGTVTFADGGSPIGSATLSAGVATLTISMLAVGSHSITASYAGSTLFSASTSPALAQTVNVPIDSVRLRSLQQTVSKMVAQNSGQALSGAIDDAIADGFSDGGGTFMTPGSTRMRFNFSVDPRDQDERAADRVGGGTDAYSSGLPGAPQRGRAVNRNRVDDAFAAIDRGEKKQAAPNWHEQKEWLLWADVRNSGVDRWGTTTTGGVTQASQASLYGQQLNAAMGLTYRATPSVLVGVLGGYETFSYTQQDINGKLKGDGWTTGAYLGWKIVPTLRFDAALAYSGTGYNGSAGTAQGSFTGQRWMASTGLTGTYKWAGFVIEPSAKVYALWEHQNAYTDSLGTRQGSYDFASGRASGGLRAAYTVASLDSGLMLTPFLGMYGDYYFNKEDANALVANAPASTPLLQGWSARATGGLGIRTAGGAALGFGAERGGIGGSIRAWTFAARARLPFDAR
uniref:IPT/TIG domain-containing protein n=1 Tax=Bradyrhizobium sp. (strain ORS 278) TaxID=114615 RepID=UPI001FCB3A6F|nr:IPT/TIG domain-containing protein [Bradyrhizobium sp. ORS 278]